jgi:hypothetical protein
MTTQQWVAFAGHTRLKMGQPAVVARAVKQHDIAHPNDMVAVFDVVTGKCVDLDLTGSEEAVIERVSGGIKRGRGRPKLGVVSREISLLPRHWTWLSTQRGGASAALRRLVELARKAETVDNKARQAIDRTHEFLWNIGGDLPGFEEATRALFRVDLDSFDEAIEDWPQDIVEHVQHMLATFRGAGSHTSDD